MWSDDEQPACPDVAPDLKMVVEAIRRGEGYQAIYYLQRVFARDTSLVELIENEWRKR